MRKSLITLQVAFSCILLIGAGLMVRSFVRLIQVNPGFQVDNVVSVRVNLNGDSLITPENQLALGSRIHQALISEPGVISAAISSSFPLDDENLLGGRPIRFRVEGDPRPELASPPVTSLRSASVDYFRTLGIPLISGRTFRDSDDADSPQVVILNHALAVKHWGKTDPVGKRITSNNGRTWLTIIGVVGNVKEFGLNAETPFQLYRPQAQAPFLSSVVVRTALDGNRIAEDIRRVLQKVEPRMAVVRIQTMEQARAKSIASPRTLTHLFSVFGVLAFVIAIFGIASMLSLWVKQRTRETGIRMALGATPHTILTTVIRQGMMLAGIGTVLGLAGALAVTNMLASLLFQVKTNDAITYSLTAVCLLLAALLACYAPARRASRIDPQLALHSD